jgi:hypothetical protein
VSLDRRVRPWVPNDYFLASSGRLWGVGGTCWTFAEAAPVGVWPSLLVTDLFAEAARGGRILGARLPARGGPPALDPRSKPSGVPKPETPWTRSPMDAT